MLGERILNLRRKQGTFQEKLGEQVWSIAILMNCLIILENILKNIMKHAN